MIRFKNLKQGSSIIEIMVALTLLAIFGSSIFLVQSNIFTKIFKTHQTSQLNQDIAQQLIQLKTKIQQSVLQKKDTSTISLELTKEYPHRKINTVLKKIPENSSLFKSFEKNIRIVENTVRYENNRDISWFTFAYIPTLVEKKEEPKTSSPVNAKGIA